MEVAMGLNIKDERIHELAHKLADLTGDSMTGVIRKALEEKLELQQSGDEQRPRGLRETTDNLPPLLYKGDDFRQTDIESVL
jgi:hypothetical protein